MDYPSNLTSQLKANDTILYYLPLKNNAYVALTEERVIYQARIIHTDSSTNVMTKGYENANLPISKISSMSTRDLKIGSCLFKKRVATLLINMQGAVYNIYIGKDSSVARQLVQKFTEIS